MHIQWSKNNFKHSASHDVGAADFYPELITAVHKFHQGMPGYQATPLHDLPQLAHAMGIKHLYVKDESKRFGLNAFKGLGVSYAMARYFATRLAMDVQQLDFASFIASVKAAEPVTFVTATDGNHGKGVAWAANMFGHKAVVYLPQGAASERLNAIKNFGAEAVITDMNYDDTVQFASQQAKDNGWVLLQDTAWPGYQTVPLYIMQGYTTICAELLAQLNGHDFEGVSHVFLQAGVGSFAGAMTAAITSLSAGSAPKIVIVEPDQADCLYRSVTHPQGQPRRVHGDLATIMAGLACGEPNPYAWEIIKNTADYFFSCADAVTESGMRLLGKPLPGDPQIIAGESGAVTTGLVHQLLTEPALSAIKDGLTLNEASTVLVINTEGDTDPGHYQAILNADEQGE